MKLTPITALLSLCIGLAACGPESSENNGTNNATNNGTNNGTIGSNNGTTDPNNGTTGSNNGTTVSNNGTTNNLPAQVVGFATTADFASSASAWLPILLDTDGYRAGTPVAFGAGDVGLSQGDSAVYVLDRTAGVVQVLQPDTPAYEIGEIELAGMMTNPHAATDAGGKTYISLYDAGEIAVAQSVAGAWSELDRIALANFDADGNPEPAAIIADGKYVLVVLQTLEDFAGVENSQLVVIDSDTDELVTLGGSNALDLGLKNCAGGLTAIPGGGFAVGCLGEYAVNDGAIVRIESSAAGSYTVGDVIVTEAVLGGDVLDFAMTGADSGIATLSLADFSSKAVRFDADGVTDFEASTDPSYAGLDVSSALWAIGDRTANALVLTDDQGIVIQSLELEQAPAGFRFVAD